MMNLPSKGWGPWRKEFYSFHSNSTAIEADTEHTFGTWSNVWSLKISSILWRWFPHTWVKVINLPPFRNRSLKKLQKHFPNLR
jgi:hypothetical protein